MIEERERYERAFELFEMPEPAFDRLVLRRERKRRNERLAAGIAAMALVFALALAFGVAWLSSRKVPADRPTPEPSTALPSAPEDWNRVAFPGTGISSIATGGPGLVAVGVDGGDDGTAAGGAIWTSSDGRAWDRVQQEFLNAFSDVTTGGPGLVAVGSQPDPGPGGPGDEAPVWTSTNGTSWIESPADPIFAGAWLQSVVEGGPGLVAVGYNQDGLHAWYSADGIAWELASVPPLSDGALSGGDAWSGMDVAASDGRLVALGQVEIGIGPNQYRVRTIVWTSDDGISWDEVQGTHIGSNEGELEITAGADGFIAMGTFGVWTSDDGVRWQPASSHDLRFDEPQHNYEVRLLSVAGGSGGYVLSGREFQCDLPVDEGRFVDGRSCRIPQVAIWTSPDGMTWSRVTPDARFETWGAGRLGSSSIVAWASTYIVAGSDESGGVTLWISEPAAGATT
jgi:hypothetical protein